MTLITGTSHILTKNNDDLLSMFRAMVFNVAIKNMDDHSKNFAFIMDDNGTWRLSPTYDVTESLSVTGEHSTSIMGIGINISDEHIMSLGDMFNIDRKHAQHIIQEIRDITSNHQKYIKDVELHIEEQLDLMAGLAN